jgi:predicted nucleic acid-binding protein
MDKEGTGTPVRYYCDADLLIAMLKEEDELKASAVKVFTAVRQKRIEVFTSGAALLEVLFWASKTKTKRTNVREYTRTAARLVSEVAPLTYADFVIAAEHLSAKHVFTLDALHAAAAGLWPILSSDAIFEKLGLRRVDPVELAKRLAVD